jgi:hypothetical protein
MLVDEVIRQTAGRDFEFEPVCPTKRRVDAKWEEELQVHWLRGLNQQLPQLGQQEPWFECASRTLKPLAVPGNHRAVGLGESDSSLSR